jgi:hypothetical protein
MDFLTLAIIYTVVFVAFSYVLLLGGSSFHQGGFVSWIRRKLFKVCLFLPKLELKLSYPGRSLSNY